MKFKELNWFKTNYLCDRERNRAMVDYLFYIMDKKMDIPLEIRNPIINHIEETCKNITGYSPLLGALTIGTMFPQSKN